MSYKPDKGGTHSYGGGSGGGTQTYGGGSGGGTHTYGGGGGGTHTYGGGSGRAQTYGGGGGRAQTYGGGGGGGAQTYGGGGGGAHTYGGGGGAQTYGGGGSGGTHTYGGGGSGGTHTYGGGSGGTHAYGGGGSGGTHTYGGGSSSGTHTYGGSGHGTHGPGWSGGTSISGKILSANALIRGLSKFPRSKWHEFGLELNVPGDTLKRIEYDYMITGRAERCFSETMEWWYNQNPGATWGAICAALQAIHLEPLAKEVAKDHGCSPVIVKQPESRNVNLGEKNVTFKCEAAGTPPLQYSWKFNGHEMTGKTESMLTIANVDKNVAGTYLCVVKNRYSHVAFNSVELRIGKEVTEDSMCDLLIRSGVLAADWLVIAKQLKLSTQILAGAFLKAWKETDYTRPSWEKLAKALRAIGGDWYQNASQQAERNAGHDFTVEKICETFKEAKIEEPNWHQVSSKLGLVLYGQVSSTELYHAWCTKSGPSWKALFQVLQKFDRYQQVAKLAKKKAGLELNADNVRQALGEAGIKSPDWKRIGKELGLRLKGCITASIFFEGWQAHKSEMSWERLAQALEKMEGYGMVAKKARKKTGLVLNRNTMCQALQKAGIQTPDWEKIGKALGFNPTQFITADIFFESWQVYGCECQPSWNKLASVLESIGTQKYKQAAVYAQAKEGQMTTDSICAVMHKADIQLQNWEKIAKSLNLDCIVLPVAFFNQWSALADQCHPSWKALARALESNQDHKYKQAAKKALQAEGSRKLTEEAICSMLHEVEIQNPNWVNIAQTLGFQLQSQTTSIAFFDGWYKFAQNVAPSWENLASALEKMKVKKAKVEKIREKTDVEFNMDTVCTALSDASIQPPDWVKIAKHLHVEIKLQVSADDFLQGWCTYANGLQPSWIELAEALEGTGFSKNKEAMEKIRMKQGHKLDHSTVSSILHDCGIHAPDWRSMGKLLGFESHILSIAFFKQWHAHARDLYPSWGRLAMALDEIYQCKNAAAAAHKMPDNEELNIATLLRVMGEVNSQWDKIAEKLGFKQFLKGPISAKSFLEGWHKFAQTSQPSWKQLGIALSNYKQKAEQIKQNAGQKLDAEAMHNLLTETGICSPNWEEIGNQLGWQLEGQLLAADFFDEWCANDHEASWVKLANALAKIREYQHAKSIVLEKQVQEINEDSMVATFSKACVEVPENWREIGLQLGLNLKGKLSAADFFKGWRENSSANKPSWVNLADALQKMEGYQHAASLAMKKEPAELSESNMCSVFRDIDDVNWALIGQKLCPTQVLINNNCLKQALKRWHNKMKGNPWTTWRNLAVIVGRMYGSKAGQELRQLAGVALELNAENMSMVLNKAFINEAADVASALSIPQSSWQWIKSKFGVQSWKAVLDKWKEQDSYVSWNKLAEALQKKHGVDSSQTILEISGEGGSPTIAKHPANKNIAVGKNVVFECQATGAPPLMYTWMHDGIDMPAKNHRILEIVVRQWSKGEYSCRVENEFGSSKSDPAMLTVGDFPKITSIKGEKHIKTGETINICCTATGEQPLKYSWWFSSVPSSSTVLPNEDGPTLVITDAKEKDHQGFYQCHVKNIFGHVTSDFLNIKVGNPPTVDKFAIEGTTKISFKINEEVNFYCEANGTPPLRYVWLHNRNVINERHGNKLTITAGEKTEGEYQCRVENLFGHECSEDLRIKVGTLPSIDVHPEIQGLVEPGDFLQLKCKATGKGSLHYVWQHENQTLVKETRHELIIKHVKESDQGAYRCRVTNAFGYAMSEPAVLNLTITQAKLMKELAPHVATRWYMVAVLLNIPKPIMDKISKSFIANGNVHHSLSEVVEAWLEEMNAANPESSTKTGSLNEREPSRYWLQVYHVVKRMGHVKFTRDLDAKYKLFVETADRHPEQDVNNSEEQQTEAETKPALVDTNEMQRRFAALIDKVQPLLATPDAIPTESASESVSTSESATDTSVSECQAYLDLIDFPEEETDNISDLQSLFKLLTPYLDFQRFHILEMIVGQFKSEKARQKTLKYHGLLDTYQSQVNLGKFVLAIAIRTPPANPPFMRPFSLQLESKWATCTLQDLENLLTRLLPKSIGHTFVWFCNASQVTDDNSIYLNYIVSPSVVEILKEEAEKKQGILRSAGVLRLSIDGTVIESMEVVGNERAETFLRGLENILPHGGMFQQQPLPAREAVKDQSMDTASKEEVEESPPEKSDIEKLQEKLSEREEREAELKQALKLAEIDMRKNREELETVKTEVENVNAKLQELKGKVTEKTKEIWSLKSTVNQHSSDIEKNPLLIEQASKDLKIKLQEEENRRSVFQENTTKKFGQVQSNIRSEVKTHMKAQIPELQHNMKEELEKTAQQLRDEMKKELSEMRCEVLRQHEEREERHSRRNESVADELRREISFLRQKLDEFERRQMWEIVRERREISGGGKGDKS